MFGFYVVLGIAMAVAACIALMGSTVKEKF